MAPHPVRPAVRPARPTRRPAANRTPVGDESVSGSARALPGTVSAQQTRDVTASQPSGRPTPPPGTGTPAGTAPTRRRGRTVGWSLAAALLVFVTVILVLFVVFNTQTVTIGLVFGSIQAPLVLALVVAAALGGLIVGLAGVALRSRRGKKS